MMVTAKAHLRQNGIDGFVFQQFSDYYFAGINVFYFDNEIFVERNVVVQ
jgi:hypothetical protein